MAGYRLDLSTMCGRAVGTEDPIRGGRSSLPGVIALPGQPYPLDLHTSGIDHHTRAELVYQPQVAFQVRAGARRDVTRSSTGQRAEQHELIGQMTIHRRCAAYVLEERHRHEAAADFNPSTVAPQSSAQARTPFTC